MSKCCLLLATLLLPLSLAAQYTNVTAVVKDPNGNTYNHCKVTVSFVNQSTSSQQPKLSGSVFQTEVPGYQCDSFGNLNIPRVASNTAITPTPSQWRFTVTDCRMMATFTKLITITGASQNITSDLQAVAAYLPVNTLSECGGDEGRLSNEPVDVGVTYNSTPTASLDLLRHPFPFAVTIPQNCSHSYLIAETAATASTTFTLSKCTAVGACASFGTAVFGISGTVATFTCASSTSFDEGNYIKLTAPGTPDGSIAKIGGAIYGTRLGGVQ